MKALRTALFVLVAGQFGCKKGTEEQSLANASSSLTAEAAMSIRPREGVTVTPLNAAPAPSGIQVFLAVDNSSSTDVRLDAPAGASILFDDDTSAATIGAPEGKSFEIVLRPGRNVVSLRFGPTGYAVRRAKTLRAWGGSLRIPTKSALTLSPEATAKDDSSAAPEVKP